MMGLLIPPELLEIHTLGCLGGYWPLGPASYRSLQEPGQRLKLEPEVSSSSNVPLVLSADYVNIALTDNYLQVQILYHKSDLKLSGNTLITSPTSWAKAKHKTLGAYLKAILSCWALPYHLASR